VPRAVPWWGLGSLNLIDAGAGELGAGLGDEPPRRELAPLVACQVGDEIHGLDIPEMGAPGYAGQGGKPIGVEPSVSTSETMVAASTMATQTS